MAEWLRSGLQIRVYRFDSGRGLHPLLLLSNRSWPFLRRSSRGAITSPHVSSRRMRPMADFAAARLKMVDNQLRTERGERSPGAGRDGRGGARALRAGRAAGAGLCRRCACAGRGPLSRAAGAVRQTGSAGRDQAYRPHSRCGRRNWLRHGGAGPAGCRSHRARGGSGAGAAGERQPRRRRQMPRSSSDRWMGAVCRRTTMSSLFPVRSMPSRRSFSAV